MLNGDTDRLPSRTDVLNEKSLVLPVIQMGGRQSAQPSLHHQLPDRAVLEARNLEKNVWEVEGVGRGMHLSCCKYCVPLLYWNNQEKWWERRSGDIASKTICFQRAQRIAAEETSCACWRTLGCNVRI